MFSYKKSSFPNLNNHLAKITLKIESIPKKSKIKSTSPIWLKRNKIKLCLKNPDSTTFDDKRKVVLYPKPQQLFTNPYCKTKEIKLIKHCSLKMLDINRKQQPSLHPPRSLITVEKSNKKT